MKVIVFLFLAGAASASPLLFENDPYLNNAVDELVKKYLEYVRWLLKRHEPFDFPALPEQHLIDDYVDLKFSTSNVKVSKASEFTVDKISNNLPKLTSSFGITNPKAHFEGNYEVTGVAFKKAVKGSGTFKADFGKFVQTGEIQFAIVDHSLQIDGLKLDYQLSGATFDVQGLDVEGITKEQIDAFLNKNFINYLEQHKDFVTEKTANHVKQVVNKILYGHSLQSVIDWLKQIVATTPDPPVYPPFQNNSQ